MVVKVFVTEGRTWVVGSRTAEREGATLTGLFRREKR